MGGVPKGGGGPINPQGPLLTSQDCPEKFFWESLLPILRYLDFAGCEFLETSKITESETLIWRDRGSDIRKIPVLQGKKKKLGALTRHYDLRWPQKLVLWILLGQETTFEIFWIFKKNFLKKCLGRFEILTPSGGPKTPTVRRGGAKGPKKMKFSDNFRVLVLQIIFYTQNGSPDQNTKKKKSENFFSNFFSIFFAKY